MQEYVLVFVQAEDDLDKVLLILKDRPAHLKGRFNLPGGKVDPGEYHKDAAYRELYEETGYEPEEMILAGKIDVTDSHSGIIYLYKTKITTTKPVLQREGETEPVSWYDWNEIIKDNRIMPNLRLTIPLMKAGIYDWVIYDRICSIGKKEHNLNIKFNIPLFTKD